MSVSACSSKLKKRGGVEGGGHITSQGGRGSPKPQLFSAQRRVSVLKRACGPRVGHTELHCALEKLGRI